MDFQREPKCKIAQMFVYWTHSVSLALYFEEIYVCLFRAFFLIQTMWLPQMKSLWLNSMGHFFTTITHIVSLVVVEKVDICYVINR